MTPSPLLSPTYDPFAFPLPSPMLGRGHQLEASSGTSDNETNGFQPQGLQPPPWAYRTSSNPEASPQSFTSFSPTSQTSNVQGAMSPLILTPVLSPVVDPYGLLPSPLLTTPGEHNMTRITGTENETMDTHLAKDPYNPRKLTCRFEGCDQFFEGRLDLAREHIRIHLRITKLYRCQAW